MILARSISWQTTTLPNGTTIAGSTLIADAFLEERHDDDSIITENPVENGSVTNDHKYDLPQELELTYVWSPGGPQNSARDPNYMNTIYALLLSLKSAAIFLTITTGKRLYKNVLIKTISETTDKNTENILQLRIVCRQLILAITQTVTLSNAAVQAFPQRTSSIVNQGSINLQPAPNFNTGTQ